ncbi:hypothetical protein A2971_04915 [Candidatus Gottesmanbacteria bacterium RIFCSPLOWO2_01_FULL_46_21]|uniref:Transcription regulator TrmB N-terminal domain-containing protein n=1 Tax=Candidatus Gottesmanbacteria bacterium RIFCSPLOWO2_01_FULL_46_21 TaxID=1798393 RepID=A0A1F6AWB4_9BACT|nr:MAG: hypothetical protein A2971_04915 [Candidatus Gottesmanbacteria bacterium RIFCSPLOWO2_01_FULL_46_21]
MIQDIFSQFHLDQKETGAFLELVKLGASPVSVWAKHAGINRSSMYVIMDRLMSAGLVTIFAHRGIMHAQAVAVSTLPSLLEAKQKDIEEAKRTVSAKLPELLALEKTNAIVPKIQFFEGKHRVEAMYEEVLKERSFTAFFHPGRVKATMPEYFHKIPQAIKANGGRAKELLVRCREALEYKRLYASTRHAISILPEGVTFSSDTIITKQKIYLVGYGKDTIVGTEIWNSELSQTQSVLFDLLWETYGR